MREIRFVLPEPTPSNNQLLRMHWAVVKKNRARYRKIIEAQIHTMPPFEKCGALVTRYGGKLLDYDNLYGGVKTLLDAITDAGIWLDDNPTVLVDFKVEQIKTKKSDQRTEIKIWLE